MLVLLFQHGCSLLLDVFFQLDEINTLYSFKVCNTLTSSAVIFSLIKCLHSSTWQACGYSLAENVKVESGSQHLHSLSFPSYLLLGSALLSNPCFSSFWEPTKATNYFSPLWQASKFSFGIILLCSFPWPFWLLSSLPFPYLFDVALCINKLVH